MYRCKHFSIHELVHPSIYKARGESAWKLLDERILMSADILREDFGALYCNNWHVPKVQSLLGETYKFSGMRPMDSSIGALWSDHKFGRALDLKSLTVSADEMRKAIIQDRERYKYIMCIEANVSWLHISCRNISPIEIVYP